MIIDPARGRPLWPTPRLHSHRSGGSDSDLFSLIKNEVGSDRNAPEMKNEVSSDRNASAMKNKRQGNCRKAVETPFSSAIVLKEIKTFYGARTEPGHRFRKKWQVCTKMGA